MKLQVAIDRVSLEYAVEMAQKLDPVVDIVELGTSLVKDYGLLAIKESGLTLSHAQLLLDLKTIDEGPYEFDKGYRANGDILTVMGASAVDTITKVYEVTKKFKREMFIDLMQTDNAKVSQIATFGDAIYGIHHSKDSDDQFDAAQTTAQFHQDFPGIKRIAVAGGIDLEMAKRLSEQNIAESVIVGSAVMKADDPVATAKEFMEAIN